MKRQHPKYPNTEFAKDLWHFLKDHKREFIFVTILLVIGFGLNLVGPIILAKIIDFFATPGKSISIFYIYLGILAGVEIIATLFRRGGKYCSGILSGKIQKDVKIESFQKLIQRDLLWHDTSTTGIKTQKIMEGESALSKLMIYSSSKFEGLKNLVNSTAISKNLISHYLYFARDMWGGKTKAEGVKKDLYALRVYMTGISIFEDNKIISNIGELNKKFNYPIISKMVDIKKEDENRSAKGYERKELERIINQLDIKLIKSLKKTSLPDKPDINKINKFLVNLRVRNN
tara:strand:- start:527 stop:1390 length:864 start_codon:yes stop_codon:yes gene_type:complete